MLIGIIFLFYNLKGKNDLKEIFLSSFITLRVKVTNIYWMLSMFQILFGFMDYVL